VNYVANNFKNLKIIIKKMFIDLGNIYRPTWMHKSPLIVPGFEFFGSVAPRMKRPVLTTSNPSQTYNLIT